MRNFDKKRRCCKDQRKMLFSFGVRYEYFLFFFFCFWIDSSDKSLPKFISVQFSTFFEKSCLLKANTKQHEIFLHILRIFAIFVILLIGLLNTSSRLANISGKSCLSQCIKLICNFEYLRIFSPFFEKSWGF